MKWYIYSLSLAFTLAFNCHTQIVLPQSTSEKLEPGAIALDKEADSVDSEFIKLFIAGFFETFLYYYGCDVRVNSNMPHAFVHCTAGGFVVSGASRLGSMPKLTLDDWTKSEIIKHASVYLSVQVIARLWCMLSLFYHISKDEREAFESRFVIGYDLATYTLLAIIPLLKRRAKRGTLDQIYK